MHEHMTLHAHSTPYQATVAPAMLLSEVGTVRDCFDKAITGDCPAAAPIYSVREFIGNFKIYVETMGRPRKIPFFLEMRQWWPP